MNTENITKTEEAKVQFMITVQKKGIKSNYSTPLVTENQKYGARNVF